ncbi:GNAT family N-acetyltransferase [Peptacetobacter hominis]|uniref:GNAT family N-acetyltransferase n=1 Tax=Peptacetobacter hominis TaxID=2743610 RepID=A0A544QXH7_9FIRM|nr:GNAT family N-acetyltransferase [Peptacetobacter hominis]TQQ85355.1 GNAT family N-acetyltransferase [Peptacetobacter hominis]
MHIRRYKSDDVYNMAKLFYDTVHSINLNDYNEEQVNAWANGNVDLKLWDERYLNSYTVISEDKDIMVGFGNIDKSGYLDMLYVHKDYQKMGIATMICNELEKQADNCVSVHASITAKPFFEKRGYIVIKEQRVNIRGVYLTNYVMEKRV